MDARTMNPAIGPLDTGGLIYMHNEIARKMGIRMPVVHIDGDTLNNRRENLRSATEVEIAEFEAGLESQGREAGRKFAETAEYGELEFLSELLLDDRAPDEVVADVANWPFVLAETVDNDKLATEYDFVCGFIDGATEEFRAAMFEICGD
jgi:HNH endonuclease